MSFEECSGFSILVQVTDHIYGMDHQSFELPTLRGNVLRNILQKQIRLVPSKNEQLTRQLCLMYVFPGRLNAPVSRRNTITWNFEQ